MDHFAPSTDHVDAWVAGINPAMKNYCALPIPEKQSLAYRSLKREYRKSAPPEVPDKMVEQRGIEPLASALRTPRSPN
jgi:hypothetical protein